MKKLIVLAAVAALCWAAPSEHTESSEHSDTPLERPSPINPQVPMDPKPAETITKITDPVEIAKHKRESDSSTTTASAPLMPTLPTQTPDLKSSETDGKDSFTPHQLRQQRDITAVNAPGKPSDVKAAPADQKSVGASAEKTTPVPPKRKRRPASSTAAPVPASQDAPIKHRQKREEVHGSTTAAPVPLIFRDRQLHSHADGGAPLAQEGHPYYQTPQTLPGHLPEAENSHHFTHPQTLPALSYSPAESHQGISAHKDAKRDIPVPLVPKHQHPEESPKEEDKSHEHPSTADPKAELKPQGEDLQSHVPSQDVKPEDHSHQLHKREEEKNENEKMDTSASSTSTEHPLIRPSPVPVAELLKGSNQ